MTSLLCSKLFTASRRSKQEITTSHLPLQVKPARKRCSSQKLDGPQVPQHSCFSCISKPHSHMTQVLGNKDTTPEGRLSWTRALGYSDLSRRSRTGHSDFDGKGGRAERLPEAAPAAKPPPSEPVGGAELPKESDQVGFRTITRRR